MKSLFTIIFFMFLGFNSLFSEVYYFAYGSNLNQTQMRNRIGTCELIGIGCLPNYTVKFNKKAEKTDNVYANIEPQQNSCVYGAVYKLADDQLAKMDQFEGFKGNQNPENHYEKQEFDVTLLTGDSPIKVIAYVAANKYRVSETSYKPTEIYLKTILEGAVESGLPAPYIQDIHAKAGLNPIEH